MGDKTSVVIVGAGTCGLAAACELRRMGVSVRLLEARPGPNTGSRATLLWPLGLAVLRSLGALAEAEQRGLRLNALQYHMDGDKRLRTRVGAENEALVLAQDQTSLILERILEELGGRVERSTRVVDVAFTGEGITVKAQQPDSTELIEADWLIAADGVGSTVRQALGIDFPGVALPTTYLATEGRILGDLEPGDVHYFLRASGSMVVAPLRGGKVRLGAPIPEGTELTEATVERLLRERGSTGMRVESLDEITTFSSQERIAAALRKGPCFLVGDAAHTHSPIGGQGLNLGLQDVHNLAWKLAGVVRGVFHPAILDSYEPERRQAAQQTVQNTGRFAKMFMLSPAKARMRNTAWRGLEATGLLRRRFVPLLAGWRVSYPDALFATAGPVTTPRGMPSPGTRVPPWVPAPSRPGPGTFRLLTLGDRDGDLRRRAQDLAGTMPGLVSHDHHSERGRGFLLLRPDGFVARSGTTPDDLDRAGRLLAGLTPNGRDGREEH
jgi:2-polyprenyl-6-methoxyphenol hydroxylase-like FAD-dependent oxidoreductase